MRPNRVEGVALFVVGFCITLVVAEFLIVWSGR